MKNVILEHLYHKPMIDPAELLNTLHEYRDMIAPFVCDVSAFLDKALKEGKTILLEGQLGTMKDPDHGNLPHGNFFLHVGSIYGAIGAGIPPYEIKQIVTVSKAYSSSVGAGAFVSEIFGDEADELRHRGGDGGEFGATTGRPRRWDGSTVLPPSTAVVCRALPMWHLPYWMHWDIWMRSLYV